MPLPVQGAFKLNTPQVRALRLRNQTGQLTISHLLVELARLCPSQYYATRQHSRLLTPGGNDATQGLHVLLDSVRLLYAETLANPHRGGHKPVRICRRLALATPQSTRCRLPNLQAAAHFARFVWQVIVFVVDVVRTEPSCDTVQRIAPRAMGCPLVRNRYTLGELFF